MVALACPECQQGKHRNCAEARLDDDGEILPWCDCKENGHPEGLSMIEQMNPYEVEFTVKLHVLAKSEDAAYEIAEPFAQAAGAAGEWTNYDKNVVPILATEYCP